MKKIIILSLLLSVISSINAQPGTLDPNFNSIGGFNSKVCETWELSDGKILVVGYFSHYRGQLVNKICRLNSDGTLDPTFLSGTGIAYGGYAAHVRCQPDGKILVMGNVSDYNGIVLDHAPIIRLNADGSFDNTFNVTFYGDIKDILIQSSGKIVVVGSFQYITGTSPTPPFFTGPKHVVRLNANGTRDATFGSSTGANNAIVAVRQQQDGKLVFVGAFTTFNGVSKSRICRTDANGVIDNTFLMTSNVNASGMYLQADEKVILIGGFSSFNGNAISNIVRINTDGSVDNTFTCTLNLNVWSIASQPDGKFVIVGGFTSVNGASCHMVARINSDGSTDAGFNLIAYKDIIATSTDFFVVNIQANGKILIGGTFSYYGGVVCNHLLRLDATGNIDLIFTNNGGTNLRVYSVVNFIDGKILLGGDFQSYRQQPYSSICRLDGMGNIDPTFVVGDGFGASPFYPEVYDIEVQSDGRYLVAGSFNSYKNADAKFLTRINTDGSKDLTFLTSAEHGGNANSIIRDIALQSDGKIIAVGRFDVYYDYVLNAVARSGICRINTNGSLDDSFDPGTGTDTEVLAVKIQPDGMIVAVGKFTTYNGNARNHIVRINTNGTIDNAFNIGSGTDNDISKLYLLSGGRILIVGNFTTYNGISANNVAILNSDGTIDNTFAIKAHDGTITDVLEQADGKFLIASNDMTTYDNTAHLGIARINADGTVDNTFNKSCSLVLGFVTSKEEDQVFIIGGHSMLYDNHVVNSVGRIDLNTVTTSVMGFTTMVENNADYILFPNPGSGSDITLKYVGTTPVTNGEMEVFDPTGKRVLSRIVSGNETIIEDLQLHKGFYVVKITNTQNDSATTLKLIVQ